MLLNVRLSWNSNEAILKPYITYTKILKHPTPLITSFNPQVINTHEMNTNKCVTALKKKAFTKNTLSEDWIHLICLCTVVNIHKIYKNGALGEFLIILALKNVKLKFDPSAPFSFYWRVKWHNQKEFLYSSIWENLFLAFELRLRSDLRQPASQSILSRVKTYNNGTCFCSLSRTADKFLLYLIFFKYFEYVLYYIVCIFDII